MGLVEYMEWCDDLSLEPSKFSQTADNWSSY